MSSTVPATQANFKTLTEALDNNANTAYTINYLGSNNKESNVNFSELKSRALGILFNLQKHNIKPGEQLIIHSDNNELFLDAFWAGLYGGIIPVPVAVASNDEHRYKLLRIFNKLESPWLYTDSETLNKILAFCETNQLKNDAEQLRSKTILIDEIDDVSQLGEPHTVKPDDIAFIQFSSGSTSEPKGVVLTHKNIMTNIHAIIVAAEFTQADTFFGWMPLTHDLGMIGFHLTPIVIGINHTIMETNVFVRRPLLWLIAVSQKQSTILCSPNFGYKHFLKVFDAKGIEQIDLSHVRLIFNGAEPISIEICEQFLTAMKPYGLKSNSMYPVYGLAEASLAVSFPNPADEIESIKLDREHLAIGDKVKISSIAEQSVEFVLTGKPINDCQVRITDENNNTLASDTVGRIQLKGDNVTGGYYLENEINQQIISQDGWLDTGDLGAFVRLGSNNDDSSEQPVSDPCLSEQLIITGRMKDIIFVNGLTY
jgi:acyl-CoA synthetase (AMP-forming)/AMP-acid ligase II